MKRIVLTISFIFMALAGCEKNDILSSDQQISAVELNVSGLQDLGDSAWYELWLTGASGTKSVGVFSVDGQGVLSPTRFDVNLGYLQEGNVFLLTVEEDDVPGMRFTYTMVIDSTDSTIRVDTLLTQSIYLLAAMPIEANYGAVSLGNEAILDFNFMEAAGTYMLATPTDSTVAENSGIWFVNDTSTTDNSKIAGLTLPKLPARWTYEGWVDFNGTPVSTGRFLNPEAVDKQALYSGDEPVGVYKFPGEDFIDDSMLTGITFPTDLSGRQVYITLTPPYPAVANVPFMVTVLSATIPQGAQPDVVYEMDNVLYDEPFIMSSIEIDIKLYE